jgi:hypothetical protein
MRILFFLGGELGFELRALISQRGSLPLEPHLPVHFALLIFGDGGVYKLFAQAGLEWQSSSSQPLK